MDRKTKNDSAGAAIVFCADDFGMSAAVNAAILALAAQRRLSATSVLVDGPQLGAEQIAALRASGLQLGLHLNLTESFGQNGLVLPLRRLLLAAYARRLPRARLRSAIEHQLARFVELFGQPPDYVDGHQHVHQLPQVRAELLAQLEAMARVYPHEIWLRDTASPVLAGLPWRVQFKALVIAALGARALRRAARARGWRQNTGFMGVYDFQGGEKAYGAYLRQWLRGARPGGLLMCHPALGADPNDPLIAQRNAEYRVLSGAPFGQWLESRGWAIAQKNA